VLTGNVTRGLNEFLKKSKNQSVQRWCQTGKRTVIRKQYKDREEWWEKPSRLNSEIVSRCLTQKKIEKSQKLQYFTKIGACALGRGAILWGGSTALKPKEEDKSPIKGRKSETKNKLLGWFSRQDDPNAKGLPEGGVRRKGEATLGKTSKSYHREDQGHRRSSAQREERGMWKERVHLKATRNMELLDTNSSERKSP